MNTHHSESKPHIFVLVTLQDKFSKF